MTFNVFGLLKIQKLFYKNVRVVPSEAPIKLIYLGDTERLTTEMGECRGCQSCLDQGDTVQQADYKNAIKLIYCQGGIWIIWTLGKSVQHYTKRWSYWVVILILLKIKYLAKSFVIIMWHVLSKPMALQTIHNLTLPHS